MNVGDIITLEGISAKGKQRIKRDGSKFTVRDIRDSVTCLNNAGIFVCPVNKPHNSRWIVFPDSDPDFKIVDMKPKLSKEQVVYKILKGEDV